MSNNFDIDVLTTDDAESKLGAGSGRGRTSKYEPVAQKWDEIEEDEAIILSDLSENDIQNLRNLMYRRFGKDNLIVRSARQEDDTFKAVVRTREDGEYLREDDQD